MQVFNKPAAFVPTLFSPNGDGINEELKLNAVGLKQLYYFRIFNRSGKMVFQTNDLNKGWNGKAAGRLQTMETYTWVLSAQDKDGKYIGPSGQVTLVR